MWLYCPTWEERNQLIDLYLSSFSVSCSSYIYSTMVFCDLRLRMSQSFYRAELWFYCCGNIFILKSLIRFTQKLYLDHLFGRGWMITNFTSHWVCAVSSSSVTWTVAWLTHPEGGLGWIQAQCWWVQYICVYSKKERNGYVCKNDLIFSCIFKLCVISL